MSMCKENNVMCLLFDETTKSVSKYCDHFDGIKAENCSNDIYSGQLEPSQVIQLRIAGCNNETVLDAIKTFPNVHVLNLSYSGYKSLKWLNLKLEQLRSLNVSHNGLSFIPWELVQQTPELTEIDLSYNELTNIDAKRLFGGAGKLTKIYLSHNSLHSINSDAFSTLTNLEFIDLRNNRFVKVAIFSSNFNLKTIHLEENPIASFDCSYSKVMSSTVSVFLSWKNVTSFFGHSDCEEQQMRISSKSEFEGVVATENGTYELHCNEKSFISLRHFLAGRKSFENVSEILQCFMPTLWLLDFSGNTVENVNISTFDRFVDLNTLFLSDTMLTDFDLEAIKNLKNLTKFDISHNNLRHLKNVGALESLDNLNEINLAGNDLENTQEVIQHMKPTIEKLDLSQNFVGTLNATTFERFTALKKLNLSNTSLSIADKSPFEPFNSLTSLDISHNNLENTNFDVLLTILNKLVEFRVADCQLKSISKVLTLLGTSLEILDLSGNGVGRLNAQTLEKFSKLKQLNLSSANLTYLDREALKNQIELNNLDVSNNQLQEIDLQLVSNGIKHLNLEGNELTRIGNFSDKQFLALQTLGISKNQLPCDDVKEIVDWGRIKMIGDPFDQKHGKNCNSNSEYLIAAFVLVLIVVAGISFSFRKLSK